MDFLMKNEYITNELEKHKLYEIKKIIDSIEGEINIQKVYQHIFKSLNINYYIDNEGDNYIELKRYIEIVSNNNCKEAQILKNKEACDLNKIKRLKDIDILTKYECNKLTINKRLVNITGLNTINDSIKRFSKIIPVTFIQWYQLCEIIVVNLPIILEKAVKNYIKKEFDKINIKNNEQQKQIEDIEKEMKNKDIQITYLQNQLDEIKCLLNKNE